MTRDQIYQEILTLLDRLTERQLDLLLTFLTSLTT